MHHHQDDLLTLRLAYRDHIVLRRSVDSGVDGPRVALVEALEGAALVVDVHASNIYLREVPLARIQTRENLPETEDTYLLGHGH